MALFIFYYVISLNKSEKQMCVFCKWLLDRHAKQASNVNIEFECKRNEWSFEVFSTALIIRVNMSLNPFQFSYVPGTEWVTESMIK